MNDLHIINNANGEPINYKYSLNKELYGPEFGGYKNKTEELVFHEFAVLKKDLSFMYNGNITSIAIIHLQQHTMLIQRR